MMVPKTSTSLITLPAKAGPSRAVENVAIERASKSIVIDAVDDVIRLLPPKHKTVMKLRYGRHMTYRRIAKEMNTTKSTVNRRVDFIRSFLRSKLCQLDIDISPLLRDKTAQ